MASGAAPAPDATPPPAPGAAAGTAADKAQTRDASIDRGLLTGHAETIGENNWTINSYELLLLGVTYGLSDDVQMSFTTMLPVTTDIPLVFSLGAKWAFYRSDKTVVAAKVWGWWGKTLGSGSAAGSVQLAFYVDNYFDDKGRFALHAGFQAGALFGNSGTAGVEFAKGALLMLELGTSIGVSDSVKLLLEVQLPAGVTKDKFTFVPFALINYGVRFHGEDLGVDLGFIRPVGDVDTGFVLGLPYVAFSARF